MMSYRKINIINNNSIVELSITFIRKYESALYIIKI